MQDELPETPVKDAAASPLLLLVAGPLLGAAAGAMGWGIRGQYGHETGAMVPGVLVAFTLVFLFSRRATSLHAARAVALTAIAFSFGGTMTYGQTVGLTHDAPLVGNWAAFRWGMLGLFIKGGLWIGFAGAFLGIGLGGKKYRWVEVLGLYALLLVFVYIGIQLLNRPYDPANRVLPAVYFSDHWHWEPENLEMKPRRECWGGLLAALAGLIAYVWLIKKDRLARNMAFFGILAGGLGFPLGQSLQAYNAWNPGWLVELDGSLHEWLPSVFPERLFSAMGWNFWNMMETTFGLVLGLVLGLGLWLNRHGVAVGDREVDRGFSPTAEWAWVAVHVALLLVWQFLSLDSFDVVADFPLAMGLIPVVLISGGRLWPYLLPLPLLAIPIAGKTLRMMSYQTDHIPAVVGWITLAAIPVGITLLFALHSASRARVGQTGRVFTRRGLILTVWLYFSLNFVFFDFPWPWEPATGRSTNNWIFLACAVVLTVGAALLGWRRPAPRTAGELAEAPAAQE